LKLLERNFIITSTTIIRRAILEKTGLFCELSELTALEDYDLWLRISTLIKIFFIPEALAIYRDHPDQSLRFTQRLSHHWQGHLIILNRLQRFIQEQNLQPNIKPTIVTECALRYKKNLVKALWKEQQRIQAIGVGLNLLIAHPKQVLRWVF
jgi:GT2 family glycosyltransferase